MRPDLAEIRLEIRDFRANNNRVLNAVCEDMADLRRHVDDGFAQVDRGFREIRGRFDAPATCQQHITDLLQSLMPTYQSLISQQGDR